MTPASLNKTPDGIPSAAEFGLLVAYLGKIGLHHGRRAR